MATSKKRINITMNDEAYKALERLADQQNRSVSSVGLNLIERALELEEDLYFSKLADRRLESNEKRLSHRKVWG